MAKPNLYSNLNLSTTNAEFYNTTTWFSFSKDSDGQKQTCKIMAKPNLYPNLNLSTTNADFNNATTGFSFSQG